MVFTNSRLTLVLIKFYTRLEQEKYIRLLKKTEKSTLVEIVQNM